MTRALDKPARAMRGLLERLSPRQRQYAMLAAVLAGGVGTLWLVFAFTGDDSKHQGTLPPPAKPGAVTNIGVMPPGQQVNPVDQWIGTAGSKLAQYENDRDEQSRLNNDRQAFEARTMQRFNELEQRLTSTTQAASAAAPAPAVVPLPAAPPPTVVAAPPYLPAMQPSPPSSASTMPPGSPNGPWALPGPAAPTLTRVTLVERLQPAEGSSRASPPSRAAPDDGDARTTSTFLPVSFIRGRLLGGLDAPTGGQSQSNPQPVLIQLADNAILPNRFRGEYRECFVIAAGYGDISSERAYLRTENLSCVRGDGAAMEVKIQGSIFGEDGKVGMRGRLVTKQGQMLANALLAGVVGGIGQGLASSSTSYSTSALGTISSTSGADAYKAGLGGGVGKALDRLAQYYIKLAENTFPVIEVDAGREIDVVITKGVRIDVPLHATANSEHAVSDDAAPAGRSQEVTDDGTY